MEPELIGHFRYLQKLQRQAKKERLKEANTEGWTEHTPYCFSKTFKEGLVKWWPSTQKATFQGRTYQGDPAITALLRTLTL